MLISGPLMSCHALTAAIITACNFPCYFHILRHASDTTCGNNTGNCKLCIIQPQPCIQPKVNPINAICQMLSQRTKNSLDFITVRGITTKTVPMCSVYHAPPYEPNLTSLTPFSTEQASLSILFIL